MKRITLVLIILIIVISGCGSSKKQLERGNYDAAIDLAVRDLRRDPSDSKQIATLDRSYIIVNEQDNERIRFLKGLDRLQSYLTLQRSVFSQFQDTIGQSLCITGRHQKPISAVSD